MKKITKFLLPIISTATITIPMLYTTGCSTSMYFDYEIDIPNGYYRAGSAWKNFDFNIDLYTNSFYKLTSNTLPTVVIKSKTLNPEDYVFTLVSPSHATLKIPKEKTIGKLKVSIEPVPTAITSINMISPPKKLTYKLDEHIDLTGIKILGTTPDGSTRELAEEEIITDPSTDELIDYTGQKTVTVNYKTTPVVPTSFNINVTGEDPLLKKVTCFYANEDSTISWFGYNATTFEFSFDGYGWISGFPTSSNPLKLPKGGSLYIRGTNTNLAGNDDSSHSHFNIDGDIDVKGNIMGLLDGGVGELKTIPSDYCFYGLFAEQNGVKRVSKSFLPATGLTWKCYDGMFYDCEYLLSAPDLPATTLATCCYNSMFRECINLKTAPILPATKLVSECYDLMFLSCSSLQNIHPLNIKEFAYRSCDEMFAGCKLLNISEDSGDELVFDLSNFSTLPMNAVNGMFYKTGGSCPSEPRKGHKYYLNY